MRSQVWQAFSLLYRYPAFGRLWVGRSISLFGDAFTLIALPWFVLQITDSGTATASILLTLQLPAILTSMAIGSLIDRFQPRAIITIDNALRTLIIGLIPILYWFGLLELWMLFLLTFLAGMLVPATEVGSRSILPELVGEGALMVAYAPVADNEGGSPSEGVVTVAYACDLCGKRHQAGHNVSHANNKTKRRFLPNLQEVTLTSDVLGRSFRFRITNAALRSVDHRGGLDAFLAKAKDDTLSDTALKVKREIEKASAAA